MRLLFVADGRSPIAQNWIRHFVERGDEVYLASTFACAPDFPLTRLEVTPVAFSAVRRPGPRYSAASAGTLGLRAALRHLFGPLTIPRAARGLRRFIEEVKPDLVHAMRIPYEGMLAADAYTGRPLLVSVWGNDFTLHAPATPLMGHYTRWTMRVTQALHADCQRDVRLAAQWGFDARRPTLVAPGNGGVRTEVFFPPSQPAEEPVVFNPRGFRAYVCNEAFFQAIPLVLQKHPKARFVCAAMAGEPRALQWVNRLGIADSVELLSPRSHDEMAQVFRRAQVMVSPSTHDGTPNSLLEGMACGCLPVAGDLESIREWITPGENGLLTNPRDPRRLAEAINEALENKDLRQKAAGLNREIIAERAEYTRCMEKASEFYKIISSL